MFDSVFPFRSSDTRFERSASFAFLCLKVSFGPTIHFCFSRAKMFSYILSAVHVRTRTGVFFILVLGVLRAFSFLCAFTQVWWRHQQTEGPPAASRVSERGHHRDIPRHTHPDTAPPTPTAHAVSNISTVAPHGRTGDMASCGGEEGRVKGIRSMLCEDACSSSRDSGSASTSGIGFGTARRSAAASVGFGSGATVSTKCMALMLRGAGLAPAVGRAVGPIDTRSSGNGSAKGHGMAGGKGRSGLRPTSSVALLAFLCRGGRLREEGTCGGRGRRTAFARTKTTLVF